MLRFRGETNRFQSASGETSSSQAYRLRWLLYLLPRSVSPVASRQRTTPCFLVCILPIGSASFWVAEHPRARGAGMPYFTASAVPSYSLTFFPTLQVFENIHTAPRLAATSPTRGETSVAERVERTAIPSSSLKLTFPVYSLLVDSEFHIVLYR